MYKILLCILIIISSNTISKSQDIIILKNNDTLHCVILYQKRDFIIFQKNRLSEKEIKIPKTSINYFKKDYYGKNAFFVDTILLKSGDTIKAINLLKNYKFIYFNRINNLENNKINIDSVLKVSFSTKPILFTEIDKKKYSNSNQTLIKITFPTIKLYLNGNYSISSFYNSDYKIRLNFINSNIENFGIITYLNSKLGIGFEYFQSLNNNLTNADIIKKINYNLILYSPFISYKVYFNRFPKNSANINLIFPYVYNYGNLIYSQENERNDYYGIGKINFKNTGFIVGVSLGYEFSITKKISLSYNFTIATGKLTTNVSDVYNYKNFGNLSRPNWVENQLDNILYVNNSLGINFYLSYKNKKN